MHIKLDGNLWEFMEISEFETSVLVFSSLGHSFIFSKIEPIMKCLCVLGNMDLKFFVWTGPEGFDF